MMDPQMVNEPISNVNSSDEQVVWSGITNRTTITVKSLIVVIICVLASIYFFRNSSIGFTNNGQASSISGPLVGGIIVVFGIFLAIGSFLSSFVKKYTVTNRSVKIMSGLIVKNEAVLYYDQIRNANLQRGLLDLICGTGTVMIDTGKTETTYTNQGVGTNQIPTANIHTVFDKFESISDYQNVFNQLQTTLQNNKASLYGGRQQESTPATTPPPSQTPGGTIN